MKSTQAWGWLAAGVMALGLNGIYHDGGAAWAHRAAARVADQVIGRIAERTGPVLALASGRTEWFLAQTKMAVAREEPVSCRVQSAVARVRSKMAQAQAGFAGMEAISARQEAALARAEASRARVKARLARLRMIPAAFESGRIPVACTRVRVNIPRVNVPRVTVSQCSW